jgi:hypothetical protein
MEKSITDKTFVVMTKRGYRCWLNQRQAEALKMALLQEKKFISIDDFFFNSQDISFILPASEIEREDRFKRGEWQCSYGYWHSRGEECGHGELAKLGKGTENSTY